MFCTECGVALADGAQFCGNCGARKGIHAETPAESLTDLTPIPIAVSPLPPVLPSPGPTQSFSPAFTSWNSEATYSGMTMSQSVRSVFKKYGLGSGRATRSEYWFFTLFTVLVTFGIFVLTLLLGTGSNSPDVGTVIGSIFFIIFGAVVFIPGITVTIRRLHDAGYSGWMYLLVLIPYLGAFVILVFTLLVSQPGDNRWGRAPVQAPIR